MGVFDIINAAATAGSAAIGAASFASSVSGRKKQRQHEKDMYNQQVADQRKNWELENMYNSPEQQMQRLKAAGLNPNLAYANGATAMGGSIDSASPTVSDQSQTIPKGLMAMQQGLSSIYDLRIKDAQADLLNEKVKTQEQDTILREFQALNETIKNYEGNANLEYFQKIAQEKFRQILLKTRQDTWNIENTRADITNKNVSAQLGGSKKTGQDQQNEMDKMTLDMYKGLGLPPGLIDQILKTAPFLMPILQQFIGTKGKR